MTTDLKSSLDIWLELVIFLSTLNYFNAHFANKYISDNFSLTWWRGLRGWLIDLWWLAVKGSTPNYDKVVPRKVVNIIVVTSSPVS